MFNKIEEFEKTIARFYGSPYAVAVDCCTHAIELCLRYKQVMSTTCPAHTYISIPFTFEKLGINWSFENSEWQQYYFLGNTNIVDAAVYWKKDGYIPDTLMCLSFQFKKHLSLGRGGAILCNNLHDYTELKKMSYDGRLPNIPWAEQNINSIGYHYYMTPETAQMGLDKFEESVTTNPKDWCYRDYPYLPHMEIFNV
jgi:dTDP-4-amino-4,6-dideoxygalactose transaminase